VKEQVKVELFVGNYVDKVLCYVVPMDVMSIFLFTLRVFNLDFLRL